MEIVCVITFKDDTTITTDIESLQIVLNMPNKVDRIKRIDFYREEV